MTSDSISKLKEKKADCKERIQENRSTHFQFGSDEEPKHTEQVQKFRINTNNQGIFCKWAVFEQRLVTFLHKTPILSIATPPPKSVLKQLALSTLSHGCNILQRGRGRG